MTVSNLVRLYPLSPVQPASRPAPTVPTTPATRAFYRALQEGADLPTQEAARRWSQAILRTLGELLDRPARRALAFALPPELATALLEAPGPLHFRPRRLPQDWFLRTAALRSGASDATEAIQPVHTVFQLLKGMVKRETGERIVSALPAEVATIWHGAQHLVS
ncbi:MAG: DUF2267 domain-containing protein [Anaerolineae bacterium]|nr:DUF2267 domain-containing protein [Anaerolineae bacterium]